MVNETENLIETAELVLSCVDLDKTIDFFTRKLGFVVSSVFPADNPSLVVVSGNGFRISLEGGAENHDANTGVRIRLKCPAPRNVFNGDLIKVSPNGVLIELVDSDPEVAVPDLEPSFAVNRISDEAPWVSGRAGMRYRDLIPDRQGGRFIASHIHVRDAGPVPDYVHFHKVRFQMIYCYKGWARVVYEDQGEPFILSAGDCVLQPPEIRHRVLETSANMEVIEVSSPAEHVTHADHEMTLPTEDLKPDRDFSGQRFVHHVAKSAVWVKWRIDGFECRDTGIGESTNGLAGVKVVRHVSAVFDELIRHEAEFVFIFVLSGNLTLERARDGSIKLGVGDSIAIPGDYGYGFSECSGDLELLEVTFPQKFTTKSSQSG